MPKSMLRPKNNWPILRVFLSLTFLIASYALRLMVNQPVLGVGVLLFALLQMWLYFFKLRPAILEAQETRPETELAIVPSPDLKKQWYRLWRHVSCFSWFLSFLGVGLLGPLNGPLWFKWANTFLLVALGVTTLLQAFAELRELRREIYVLEHTPQEQAAPQAQHYGPQ